MYLVVEDVQIGGFPDSGTCLPFSAHMFGVYDYRIEEVWLREGNAQGSHKAAEVPSIQPGGV